MGNCGASGHAVMESWADDGEWEEEEASSEEGDHRHHGRKKDQEHVSEEVTIRITRRQLQELMEKTKKQAHGVGGSSRRSTEQLLADIMNSGEVHHHAEAHWHWKPALQSIPEAAVES